MADQTAPPSTSAIADVLALFGESGLVQGPGFGPIAATKPAIGRAVTVQLAPQPGSFDGLYEVLSRDLTGCVVVIAGAEDVAGSVWGQILTRAAAARGAVGVVVAGQVRDRDTLADEGIVVWGGPNATQGPSGQATVLAVDVPVVVAGATIGPGDPIVLDVDGVVSLDPTRATHLLELARCYAVGEDRLLDELAAGITLDVAYRHKRDAIVEIKATYRPPNPPEHR